MSILNPKRYGARLKAYIEPQLHLRVPYQAGLFATDPRWSNRDLDPIPPEKQTWGPIDYWSYWCSDMLAPPLASTVSTVMSLGFTARETIPIVFFGFMICSLVVTANGRIGAKYAIPFPVAVRSMFGMYGAFPAICIRAFVALMWTAILTVQAGDFLRNCIEAIWPSFKTFPNHLPASAEIDSGSLLCFGLYFILQSVLMLMPIEKLRILFLVKAVIIPPTFLGIFLFGVIVSKGGGPLVSGPVMITSTYMNKAYSALTGLNAVIGLFSSLAVNMPDFGRFSRDNLKGPHQFLALPFIGTLGSLMPIFLTAAHSYQHGEFLWYMPAVVAAWDSRAAKFFVSCAMILAIIGNQVAAGSYPFSNDITGFAPKYINIFRGTLFMIVFCFVSNPWRIIKNAAGLLSFLSAYSALMGPLAGIMSCDFYLIKKQKLNIHELYKSHGKYWYSRGWNYRPWLCFFIAVGPLIPGLAKAVDNSLDVGGAWKIYAFAWIFGFVISVLTYYVLCTYIHPHKESLSDVAVYPPKRGDAVSEVAIDGQSVDSDDKLPRHSVKEEMV